MIASRRALASTTVLVLVGLGATTGTGAAQAAPDDCRGRTPTITATADRQVLTGTEGADVISTAGFRRVTVDARGGDDLVCSTAGRLAVVEGGAGDDTLVDAGELGGDPHDATTILAGPGNDTFVGVKDSTVLSFAGATAGVRIELHYPHRVTDGAETDRVRSIRSVIGSPFPDRFVGSDGDDTYVSGPEGSTADGDQIRTEAGDDLVITHGGSVHLGFGEDRARAYGATLVAGERGDDVIVLHGSGTGRGGDGDDRISGAVDEGSGPGTREFRFVGGPGDDVLAPPYVVAGTEDARGALDGGRGTDTLDLDGRRGSVVDLAAGRVRVSGGRATVARVEDVAGSRYHDVIRGDAADNWIGGGRGGDVLRGRGGDDRLSGGPGRDRADGGPGRDRCTAEIRRAC